MVYFLQIYCSHYGPKARPVAYGLLGEDYIIEREAEDPAEDWIAPLNRALESLPIQNTLYLFHGQFETRILWPYLTKKARERLEVAADLFDEIKKRTAIASLASYRLANLALQGGFEGSVCVGENFPRFFKEAGPNDLVEQIKGNLNAMAAAEKYLSRLKDRLRRADLEIDGFSLHPFQITGKTDSAMDRYVQYDDLLYVEKAGRFTLDAPAKILPYDAERRALVLESDMLIEQSVPAPEGYLIFSLENIVYYDTLLSFIHELRNKSR
ncbi:hypothetical protein [Aedoeadaptatus acetigenes]|uniref:hypothetical protein n=1 Tax=Aedoeadaptatus acetigenes TaxID=2981723 RepID=UPI0011DDD1CC|nr:hypothetical protein [Aedoeadaptatus acetigenes]MCU6786762.1 hypothetical protein [Aedoeadaptatus acetigenes]